MTSFVAMATVAVFASLLRQHRQQCGSECWGLSVMVRDFISTWKLQLQRPTDDRFTSCCCCCCCCCWVAWQCKG